MDLDKQMNIDKAYEMLNYSYEIPIEFREVVARAILKHSTNQNLSEEKALEYVSKEQNLHSSIGTLGTHVNNFTGFVAEWIVCMEYNALKNKGNVLLTIVNPDPTSKADLLHIIDTGKGYICKAGPDVKSGDENYIINQYEKNLKEKYEIPFLDISGVLTTDEGLQRLNPGKKERVKKMFDKYPNKRPIGCSLSQQDARQITLKMISEFDDTFDLEQKKLSKEKVLKAKEWHSTMLKENDNRTWLDFNEKSDDVFINLNEQCADEIVTAKKDDTNSSIVEKESKVGKSKETHSNSDLNKNINLQSNSPSMAPIKTDKKIKEKSILTFVKATSRKVGNKLKDHWDENKEEYKHIVKQTLVEGAKDIVVVTFKTVVFGQKPLDDELNYEEIEEDNIREKTKIKNIANSGSKSTDENLKESVSAKTDLQEKRILPKEESLGDRNKPSEQLVKSHPQRYHTKDGVITKEKDAYPRYADVDDD